MPWNWPCNLKETVEVKPAACRKEYEQAFRLAYQAYRRAKMLLPRKDGLWFTPFHALPETRIALASPLAAPPVATGTIVFDSVEFGLPADWIYRDRIDTLRKKGGYLVEFTGLVTLAEDQTDTGVLNVFRALLRYALSKGATELVLCVRPEEAPFFERVLLFQRLGPIRLTQRYHAGYVVLEHLSLENVSKFYAQVFGRLPKEKNLYSFLLEESVDLEAMRQAKFNRADFVYFFMERTDFWLRLPEEDRAYFSYLYGLFEEWKEHEISEERPHLVV